MKSQTVLLIVVGVVVGLPLLMCGGCIGLSLIVNATVDPDDFPLKDPNANQTVSEPLTPQQTNPVTLANFNRIKPGMTYAEVVQIAGEPSQLMSESEFGGVSSRIYVWESGVFANMTITFQGGVVLSKAQIGLK